MSLPQRLNFLRGRYIVYRIQAVNDRERVFWHEVVCRRWRLKAALSEAAEVAFEGRGDAQVYWRTGLRRGRAHTLKGIAA